MSQETLVELSELLECLGEKADAQQSAVITAPLDGPLLVVAGAGSGKTSTMTKKALYHIINGHVTPGQILGLTFTNKATDELRGRIALALQKVRTYYQGLLQSTDSSVGWQEKSRWKRIVENCYGRGTTRRDEASELLPLAGLYEIHEQVQVYTYDSFAMQILKRLSHEPARSLISEGHQYMLLEKYVYNLPRVPKLDEKTYSSNLGSLVKHVQGLNSEISNQLLDVYLGDDELAEPLATLFAQHAKAGAATLSAELADELRRHLQTEPENPYELLQYEDLGPEPTPERAQSLLALRELQERLLELAAQLEGDPGLKLSKEDKAERKLLAAHHKDQAERWQSEGVNLLQQRYGLEVKKLLVTSPDKENLKKTCESLRYRAALVRIVFAFKGQLADAGLQTYGDVTSAAYRAVRDTAPANNSLRSEFKLVLLDEFQDTSVAQLELFSQLFKDMNVVAVGDPNQGIYAWRGASEQPMRHFFFKFAPTRKFEAERIHQISTTYRNKQAILAAADGIIRDTPPLWSGEERNALFPLEKEVLSLPLEVSDFMPKDKLHVEPLQSFSSEAGQVDLYWAYSAEQEAQLIASYCERVLGLGSGGAAGQGPDGAEQGPGGAVRSGAAAGQASDTPSAGKTPVTCAVLFNSLSSCGPLVREFNRRGINYAYSGMRTLLEDPSVSYLLSALYVSVDNARGVDAMKLLARIGLGPHDVRLLNEHAIDLAKQYQTDNDPLNPFVNSYLADAILQPPPIGFTGRSQGLGFSAEAYHRVRVLGKQLQKLRSIRENNLELALRQAIMALELDLQPENYAHEPSQLALMEFVAQARSFVQEVPSATLETFLTWIKTTAEKTRGFDMPAREPEADTVQLLTIHSSKGLQWDYVVIPSLHTSYYSKTMRELNSFVCTAASPLNCKDALPYDLHRDCEVQPGLRHAADKLGTLNRYPAEVRASIYHLYKQAQGLETIKADRNKYYVALTRAKTGLLLGGFKHSGSSKPQLPNFYLLQAADSLQAHDFFKSPVDGGSGLPADGGSGAPLAGSPLSSSASSPLSSSAGQAPDLASCTETVAERLAHPGVSAAATSLWIQDSDLSWRESNSEGLKKEFFASRAQLQNVKEWEKAADEEFFWPPNVDEYTLRSVRGAKQVQQLKHDPDLLSLGEQFFNVSWAEADPPSANAPTAPSAEPDPSSAGLNEQLVRERAFSLGGPELATAVRLLQEKARWERSSFEVYMPERLATTKSKQLLLHPDEFAYSLRRPLPSKPSRGASLGSRFHEWIDGCLRAMDRGESAPVLPDGNKFAPLVEFALEAAASRGWRYVESECEYRYPVRFADGSESVLIARIDAVFEDPNTGDILIVDWKTDGPWVLPPDHTPAHTNHTKTNFDQLKGYLLQAQLYSLVYAWAREEQVERVRPQLVFVRAGRVVDVRAQELVEVSLPASLDELVVQFRAKIDA